MKLTLQKPIYFNILAVVMWFSIPLYFSMVARRKQDYLLIATLFLINLFVLQFLEVEIDNYMFYFISFLAIVRFKNNPVKIKGVTVLNQYIITAIIIFLWLWVHDFTVLQATFFGIYAQDVHLEIQPEPLAIIYGLIVTLYLTIRNKYYVQFFIILGLSFVFMANVFIIGVLPIFIFAVYLDFLTDKKFIFNRSIMFWLTVTSLVVMFYIPIHTVNINNLAFEKYCDTATKICNNYENGTMFYGHYFAWRGYISNNTLEYGTCYCQGDRCLIPTINCGR